MTALLCPLCSQPRFSNLESLRISLLNAATQNISCPICSEVLTGLDKLTIHLFGHTLDQAPDKPQCLQLNTSRPEETPFRPPPTPAHTDALLRDTHPPNNTDHPDIFQNPEHSDPSTVNLQDLTSLTSSENPFKLDDLKDLSIPDDIPDQSNAKEDSAGLSEYMSDLLNKKLPVLNFVFTMDNPDVQTRTPSNPAEEFKCPTCDFSFQNSIILSMHQELVHSQSTHPNEPPDNLVPRQVLGDFILPRYNCHLCSKAFKMKGSLLVHYRVAHLGAGGADSVPGTQPHPQDGKTFPCSICAKSFKKEQHLTQHIKTHDGKQWQCETCNKHFTTKYFLKKHQRLHTGEMPYSCQACNKTFTFQQSYHKHLLYHSDEKPHRCPQCGRAFKELSTLHNHQRIHSGEKPFACETCGKCFRQRVSYIVHKRIHTGVLPYQCTACKKKFRYKVSQRSHKCSAQPPGVVVRNQGDLIQRILEHANDAVLQHKQADYGNGGPVAAPSFLRSNQSSGPKKTSCLSLHRKDRREEDSALTLLAKKSEL